MLLIVWLSKLSQKLGGDSWSMKVGEFSRESEALREMLDTFVLHVRMAEAVAAECRCGVGVDRPYGTLVLAVW